MARSNARRRTAILATLAAALLLFLGTAYALLARTTTTAPTPTATTTTTATRRSATTTTTSIGTIRVDPQPPPPPPPPPDYYALRRRLRSTTRATRIEATRSVLSNPARYASGTLRIAIANASRDHDPTTFPSLRAIFGSNAHDETTRGAVAMAIARIIDLRARTGATGGETELSRITSQLAECIDGGGYPTGVRRACAEGAGLARLTHRIDALRTVGTRSGEDGWVARAARRSYTRLTTGTVAVRPRIFADTTLGAMEVSQ